MSSRISTSASSARSCACSPTWSARASAIDRQFLEELSAELGQQCEALVHRIYALAGEEFNVNSTPQLRTILFEKLGLIPVKKTKTGPSTDADSLQKMADAHPIVEELLRYREVEKLRSTYADALPPLIRADGRIHATLQADRHDHWPDLERGAEPAERPGALARVNRDIRRGVHRRRRRGLLTADYSQIELRVLAHLAEDPGLIDAFERGVDVHTATAAAVFHVPEAKVDDAQRRFAKVVNYGLAYGMEAYGLGQRLDIPTHEAAEILDAYFAGFPNVKSYMVGDGSGGKGARLHDHDLRSAPPDHRARVRQLPHPSDGGADGAERTGAGLRRRHLQARDDRPRRRARRRRAAVADAAHRARRARARGARRRARGARAPSCAK